ncbi:MAG: PQQ-dependent sugar dehydrogenase [Sphingomonadaceae bacterium]
MNRTAVATLALVLAACSSQPTTAQPGGSPASTTDGKPFSEAPVAQFDAPWAMTFLPGGDMLVTQKGGTLMRYDPRSEQRGIVLGTPTVDSAGQGGLMDVVLHPDFATNAMVYLSWSEAGTDGKGVALGRGRLVEADGASRLEGFETIFRASPFVTGNGHYAGRIAFSPDGKFLFFTTGDRQKFLPAQDKGGTLGKVLRLTPEGKPAPENPLATQGFLPEVWSYGHRNPLGIAFDAQGNLWQQEMGPKGGDELNLVLPGRNYGYPLVSDGDHYDGEPVPDRNIPDHGTRPDLERFKVNWTPSISPAGLMIYSGKRWPQWRGDAFIGGLSSQALIRVDIDGTNAVKGDQWPMGARIREVEEGPDGTIWLLEDSRGGSQGRLLKLEPR